MDFVFRIMDIPLWYYAVAAAIAIVLFLCKRKWSLSLLVLYLFLVVAIMILVRKPMASSKLILQPFWSYGKWKDQSNQVISNILMFIPVSFLAANLWSWKATPFAAAFSAMIELTQYFTKRGYCEFDDIFHNTLSAVLGVLLYYGVLQIRKIISQNKNQNVR